MKEIIQDIRAGKFKQVYCLYGEEHFLIRSYKNKLKEAIVGDDSMNYQYFEGKEVDIPSIIEISETMPFFADRRLIMIENSGLFKKDAGKLPDYLDDMPVTTTLIFVEQEMDKRNRLYKKVAAIGHPAEFKRQSDAELKRWIVAILKKEEKKITEPVLDMFLSKTGNDMDYIRGELEKLISYTLDREVVTDSDIEAVCSGEVTGKVFDMVRAISYKKQKEALKLYYDLLSLKEPAMKILFLIARQFNQLLQVKGLQSSHIGDSDITKKLGINPFALKQLKQQAGSYTTKTLRSYVETCVETEESVKTGNLKDTLAVEMLIVTFSQR